MLYIAINRITELTLKDKKTLCEKTLKLCEEAGELASAVLSYNKAHGCKDKNKTEADVLEEIADVFIMAISCMVQLNSKINLYKLSKAIEIKLNKWENNLNKEQKDPGHKEIDCPRVNIRMECPECNYPYCDALYPLPSKINKE